jgi:2,5-dihydroxypyridine 5,6-dioxygenase
MFLDRIEARWIDAFAHTLRLCQVSPGDEVAILAESQSRPINPQLAELALLRLGARPFHLCLPTPRQNAPVPVRSTGASQAIQQLRPVLAALTSCPLIVDCTVEGLMHAPELPAILKSGARVLSVCNEHPDTLERLLPDEAMKTQVLAASRRVRNSQTMTVTSAAGTDLTINLAGAATVGIWGYTDKPGTLAHWPGGLLVSFPQANSVNGRLVLDVGDINLTFKRYLQERITLTLVNDYVTQIEGRGTDHELMTRYWAAWNDPAAYAVSHVGWGLNPRARYEALTMYDQRDTNGTELRAFAGNFLFSTGANEFAGRYTAGHFDLPVRGCTIALDGQVVVQAGRVVDGG